MAEEKHEELVVEQVDFDTENPRIKMALEKYGDKLSAERIHFALRSATDSINNGSSFARLRESILASRGIQTPITVVQSGDRYNCIDGNTRLAIYKDFLKKETKGDWSRIKATVLINATQRDIETKRVSAHLIGAREWPAYEKARYLHYLRNQKFLEYSEMIALCGGNASRTEIERQIDAYEDMNEYYRDVVDDTAFKIDRYSSFVELQKPKVKDAIYEAGFELKDFGEWVRDGKIFRNADVRDLRSVLADHQAREKFVNGGPKSIEQAVELLKEKTKPKGGETLASASLDQLVAALDQRISDLKYTEIQAMKSDDAGQQSESARALQSLSERILEFLSIVSE
ncbi:MAG: hypothetical protein OXD00_11860 [Gammaproteobacteria bacterium]|nr:hypothetical protein [Gammaproteobacteria bacterium]